MLRFRSLLPARDRDESVRAAAIGSLGQIGSSKTVDTLVAVARSGEASDRAAALSALGQSDDPRAHQLIADTIRDTDPQVAMSAIYAANGGGDEVDQAILAVFVDERVDAAMRTAAAYQLRSRGVALDETQSQAVDALIGPDDSGYYGGWSYGGYRGEAYVD